MGLHLLPDAFSIRVRVGQVCQSVQDVRLQLWIVVHNQMLAETKTLHLRYGYIFRIYIGMLFVY